MCAINKKENSAEMLESAENAKENEMDGSNVLIVYFSWADKNETYDLDEIGVDVMGACQRCRPW